MGIFFAGVEFFAAIDVFAASVATHRKGRHKTDILLASAFTTLLTSEFGRVKVGRVVFAQDLSFRHRGLREVDVLVDGVRFKSHIINKAGILETESQPTVPEFGDLLSVRSTGKKLSLSRR